MLQARGRLGYLEGRNSYSLCFAGTESEQRRSIAGAKNWSASIDLSHSSGSVLGGVFTQNGKKGGGKTGILTAPNGQKLEIFLRISHSLSMMATVRKIKNFAVVIFNSNLLINKTTVIVVDVNSHQTY